MLVVVNERLRTADHRKILVQLNLESQVGIEAEEMEPLIGKADPFQQAPPQQAKVGVGVSAHMAHREAFGLPGWRHVDAAVGAEPFPAGAKAARYDGG